ncbi:hypothetical protein ACI65C_006755 [Semiaphis heraclei]
MRFGRWGLPSALSAYPTQPNLRHCCTASCSHDPEYFNVVTTIKEVSVETNSSYMTDNKEIEKNTAVPIEININMDDKKSSNSIRKEALSGFQTSPLEEQTFHKVTDNYI